MVLGKSFFIMDHVDSMINNEMKCKWIDDKSIQFKDFFVACVQVTIIGGQEVGNVQISSIYFYFAIVGH
jgi:hypothetical protein